MYNKAFVPTPCTARHVSCGFRGGAAQLTRSTGRRRERAAAPEPERYV